MLIPSLFRPLRLALLLASMMLAAFPIAAHAGLMAERTRLIFEEGRQEVSMMLANTNDYPVIVQTWVDNGEGNNTPDSTVSAMLVLPPVFRLRPHEVKNLRVIYTNTPLPADRESVFWLNLYEIPLLAQDRQTQDKSSITLGINTQMKIFYRPRSLEKMQADPAGALWFELEMKEGRWVVTCHNDGPFAASFTDMKLKDGTRDIAVEQLPDMMTPPFGQRSYPLRDVPHEPAKISQVGYLLVNDTGNLIEGLGRIGRADGSRTAQTKEVAP